MSLLDVGLGGGLVLVGEMVGAVIARRRRPRIKDPKPICGCSHHFSMHDPETGVCHATWQHYEGYDERQGRSIYSSLSCTCRRYVGPEPLATITAGF